MRNLFYFLLSLLVAGGPPAAAQTAEEQVQLAWVVQRGRLLFEIDRAAWVSTDDLRERLPAGVLGTIRGWTVERDGDASIATYYAGEGEERVAVYRSRVERNRVVSREVFAEGGRPPLTAIQRRLADARGAIARFGERPCTNAPFNAAVIPPETPDGAIEVYALTAQTERATYPFGGHFRATLSASGELSGQRGFTRACFNAAMPPGRGGARPAGMFITHLLDPLPTEIHVFMSLWMGMPVFVGTGERVWSVEGDGIRLVERPSPR